MPPSPPSAAAPYRVVQWATGNIGSRSLRAVIEHPDLTLAGVYVRSGDKAGRDAGELCGLDPVGVIATNDIDEILALGADCVLYMPLACDPDEVCRVLASGANVVTTRGEFHRPASMDPDFRQRVEAACAEGGTSIHSTGSSPGFVTEAIPLVLSSLQRRLDNLTIDEFADLSQRDSPELLFGIMGFGRDPAEFDPARFSFGATSFGPSLYLVADALSVPLDSVEADAGDRRHAQPGDHRRRYPRRRYRRRAADHRHWPTRRPGPAALPGRPGTARPRSNRPGELGATGWHMSVDGDAPLDVDIRFAVPLERMGDASPGYTANRAVNAVAAVCAAAPGIRTTLDLPHIVATLA